MTAVHGAGDLGVHGFFWLMRRLRRRSFQEQNRRWERPDPLEGGRSLEALKRDYRGYDMIAAVILFTVIPAMIFFWLAVFQAIGAWAAPDLGETGRLLGPSVYAWALPALFAAIATGAWPCHWLMGLFLAERYEEYLFYTYKQVGFDSFKVFKAMAAVFAVLVVLGVGFFANTYTAFLDDRIVISGLFAASRSLPYSQIVAVRAVAGRSEAESRGLDPIPGHFEILFRDGSLWRSKDGPRDSRPRGDYPAVALAAARASPRVTGPDIVTGGRENTS